MSEQLQALINRANAKATTLQVELSKGLRDAIATCETRLSASLVENVSQGAREIARGKFLLSLEALEKKVKEFEAKTPKSVRSSGGSLLDDEQLLKKALRHVELNNMAESYRQEHERRMKELQESRDNLMRHIPAEQQADFKAMVTAIAKRG